jgi:hypothetical protein
MLLDAARCSPNDGNFDGSPGDLIVTELGIERVCTACGESWPYDPEFFYRQPNGLLGLQAMCKACKSERRPRLGGPTAIRTKLDRERIRLLREAGLRVEEIAQRLECSEAGVYRVLREVA